jgi:CheY-like chemotaxis protein
MNGLDLYDQLHATPGLEHIPAIIISSVSSQEASHEIESRHLLRVDKPFDLDEFLDTIKQALA